MRVSNNKPANLARALGMLETAAQNQAEIAVLPEMFNCPYDSNRFKAFAETEVHGETVRRLSEKAKALNMYVIAGSIPEAEEERLYNTCYVFDRQGNKIGKHRKIHLFDIDIPNQIRFKESDVLTSGNTITVVDTTLCKIGIAICYDIRFPELSRIMVLKGAELCVFPGAFNMVTGPAHWEMLVRARALDNQVFVAAVSPARDPESSYIAYGNSMAANPWGDIIARAGAEEKTIFADIRKGDLYKVRRELPLLKHRRTDLYNLRPGDISNTT